MVTHLLLFANGEISAGSSWVNLGKNKSILLSAWKSLILETMMLFPLLLRHNNRSFFTFVQCMLHGGINIMLYLVLEKLSLLNESATKEVLMQCINFCHLDFCYCAMKLLAMMRNEAQGYLQKWSTSMSFLMEIHMKHVLRPFLEIYLHIFF